MDVKKKEINGLKMIMVVQVNFFFYHDRFISLLIEILPYNKKKEHEKQCLYSTTKCPYNNSCPPIRFLLNK